MDFDRTAPSPAATGLRGLCPRCGQGHLFDGYLTLRPACEVCGLDFAFADAGDGPAFFVMSIVGVIVVALAMFVEFTFEPPIWLHMLLWLPLTCILAFGMVRPAKGLMIVLQYRHGAAQGRLKP